MQQDKLLEVRKEVAVLEMKLKAANEQACMLIKAMPASLVLNLISFKQQ